MRRRVAMISEHASPVALLGGVDAGGQNVYVDTVSRGVSSRGYDVDVFTVKNGKSEPEIVAWADGVRVVNADIGLDSAVAKDALWPRMPAFCDAIKCFARRENVHYDLIHGNFWMSGWVAAQLGHHWQIPVVQIFHATGVTKLREQGAADTSPAERVAIERSVVRAVDRLIAQCPSERDELIADYGASAGQIALIPSAVDIDRFHPVAKDSARRQLGLDPAARLIVYVGRVVPRKDIRNVVQALARLAEDPETPRATLLVLGGESERPDPMVTPEIAVLQDLAHDLDVGDRVRFVGRRQPDELHLWYSAADVAVTTPWYEPFGLTPLEAMACATPVVGSRVGGIAFTIVDGETGFLVPPRDPDALARRLALLLREPALGERLGRQGRSRVTRSFTWEQVAESTAALYGDLFSQRNGAFSRTSGLLDVTISRSAASGGIKDRLPA